MQLVQKIKDSAPFQEGMQTLRQFKALECLDMAWHGTDPDGHYRCKSAMKNQAFKGTDLYPATTRNLYMSTLFLSYFFKGRYSYRLLQLTKWAEV